MLRSFSTRSLLLVPALLGLALVAAAGCSDGAEEPEQGPTQVEGKGDLNSSSQAVSLANLQMVNGTYGAGCTSRSGPWSLSLAGYGGALDNPLLSVVTNDAACTLTVTGIKASGTLFSATPVIPLGTNFAGSASIFQSPAVFAGLSDFAGSGAQGFTNGPAAIATFTYMLGLAADGAGNLYVSDTNNNAIRKVTPAGDVSTFVPGLAGVRGIAVDTAGNAYAAEAGNNRILKILPDGSSSNLASCTAPNGVAVDGAGNVYVSSTGVSSNEVIRKITPAGAVSTLAGDPLAGPGFADGPAASARFNGAAGVAVDVAGNVYVADYNNHRIRKITPAGDVSTLAGSSAGFADGTGGAAQFHGPWGLTIDGSGNLYVGELSNHRIRKVTPAGVVTTIAGDGTVGHADGFPGQVAGPYGLALNPAGDLFSTDSYVESNRIRKLSMNPSPGELFYGNAKVNTSTFASAFVVNLLLSDDPGTASGSNNAVFASVSGSSQTDLVPPPNYSFSTAGITVQADVNGLVTSVAGNLALTDGSNTGSGYVINLGTLPATPTFTEYDAAYNAGSAVAISGANPAVPASSMLAAGVQLPATRTVIVRRSDNGVIAYQAIKITFNAPTP
jgi:sugar lactone lactonase YvrE